MAEDAKTSPVATPESAETESPTEASTPAEPVTAPMPETPQESAGAAPEEVAPEEAVRPKRARIKPAAEPVAEPDDEMAPADVRVDFADEEAALAAARQQVQDVDADIREGGRIDVHCTVSGDNDLLALSFAYDDNWVVTVNGEEVQPSALFGGLLGVSLPQGDCTVTLRYTHPGVVPGAAASLAALAAALVWWFAERRRSQNA